MYSGKTLEAGIVHPENSKVARAECGTVLSSALSLLRICFNPNVTSSADSGLERCWTVCKTRGRKLLEKRSVQKFEQGVTHLLPETKTRLLTLDSLSLRMCFSSLPMGEPRKDLLNFELELNLTGCDIFRLKIK